MKALRRWIGMGLICAVLAVSLPTSSASDIWYEDEIAVITYHHIDDHIESGGVTISGALFENQLVDLLGRGYHFISLQDFEHFFSGGKVPPNAILVTFDDGYESFYTRAYPILRKHHIPAVNFVITKDFDHPQLTTIPSLSRNEVAAMSAESRHLDFGCHSDALHSKMSGGSPLLTGRLTVNGQPETNDQYKDRIRQDTVTCINKLRALDADAADTYAYPFGAYDPQSEQTLKDAGIHFAFTTRSGMVTRATKPLEIPRINAGSPYVHVVSLNNLILRKVVASLPIDHLVPIVKAMHQIGGTAKLLKNGEIELNYRDTKYVILPDRRTVVIGPDSMYLSQQVIYRNKNNYIREDDLERILGVQLTFNPITNQYMVEDSP